MNPDSNASQTVADTHDAKVAPQDAKVATTTDAAAAAAAADGTDATPSDWAPRAVVRAATRFTERIEAAYNEGVAAPSESLEMMFQCIGSYCDQLVDDLAASALSAGERARANAVVAAALARVCVHTARRVVGADDPDAWTPERSNEMLCDVARHWDAALAHGPVTVARYAAMLYPRTVHMFDGVVSAHDHAWVRTRAAEMIREAAAAKISPGDISSTEGGAESEALHEHLVHAHMLASGALPYGLRPEHERATPQIHLSLARLLDGADVAHECLCLDSEQRVWLSAHARVALEAEEARDAGAADGASAASPDADSYARRKRLKYLHKLAQSGVPPGFYASVH